MIQENDLEHRDRNLIILFLIVIALLTIFDVWEDAIEGVSLAHMAVEVLIVTCCVAAATLLWRSTFHSMRSQNRTLQEELSRVHIDLEHWRTKTFSLTRDMHSAISHQLSKWGLTDAESDVAFLLLKGLSIKEIATLRKTSERTTRQQTAAIYQKSKLNGRAELAAFFLEDIYTVNS